MSYIPDNPDLYEFMSGIQYLNFVGDVYRVPTDIREKRIAEYSAAMGITDALAEKVGGYSHGMKQKLAIVAALMHEPKLLIMDEPFVGLDPKAAFILKQFMRKFCDNGGAIFFSTHVLEVAEKLCDKIAIIRGGKLLASGDIESVKGNESLIGSPAQEPKGFFKSSVLFRKLPDIYKQLNDLQKEVEKLKEGRS